MSHQRSWHFYLLVILLTAGVGSYLIWTFTPIKDEINSYVIKKLKPYLGDSFIISDFSIGPTSVSFYRVRAAEPASSLSLELAEIELSYNPLKLLARRFNFLNTIETVTFRNPRITLEQPGKPSAEEPVKVDKEKILEEIVRNMQKLPQIDHIAIEEGEVLWQGSGIKPTAQREAGEGIAGAGSRTEISEGSGPTLLLEHLSGRLTYQPVAGEAEIRLNGKLPGIDSSSLLLEGVANFGGRALSAKLSLDQCRITSNWPFWKLDFVEVDSAFLTGKVTVSNHGFSMDSLRLDGDLTVEKVSARIYKQQVRAGRFTARLQGHELKVLPFECEVEDGRGEFSGTIEDIFDPQIDWHLKFHDYSASNLYHSHEIFQYVGEGKMAGKAHFSGPLNAINIDADLTCPNLLYGDIPFHTVQVKLNYNTHEKLLSFPYLRADFMKFRTQGIGHVDFIDHQIQLRLNSDISVPEGYFSILNGLNEGGISVNTSFDGDYTTKHFEGDFVCRVSGEDSVLVTATGPYTLDDQLFRFNLSARQLPQECTVQGVVEHLFGGPNVSILEVKNFPLAQLTFNPLLAGFVEGRHVDIYFAGPYRSLNTKLKIVPQGQPSAPNVLEFAANIRNIFTEQQRIKGEFELDTAPKNLTGEFEVSSSDEGMHTTVRAPGLLDGFLDVGVHPRSPIRGKFNVQDFSISDYLQSSPSISGIFEKGIILGSMDIDGSVQDPQITFDLSASDFIVNGVGYYSTHLSGALIDYQLQFDNLWVRLNNERVFNASFRWNVLTDSLNFKMRADDIESNFLAETIFRDPEVIRGRFNYSIIAEGLISHPSVYGDVDIREGVFKGNPFQSISISFEDSLTPGSDYWQLKNHIIKFSNFLYINEDEYTVDAHGILSIDPYGPLDLQITAEGNVLAELPRIQSYFQNPQSTGRLFMHIRGSQNSPYFEAVNLSITDGSLQFENVIPPVTNLRAEVELNSSDNFVNIKTIEGEIDHRWVRIYNTPEVQIGGKKLALWEFEEIGLNFGVLILETDIRGIPLSVPGLMEEGEIGYFAAAGKEPGESFYISGPPEFPNTRGRLTLYNCRVTFPFIGMYENGEYTYDDENRVIDFLMNMNWDVSTVPGNNNRYFVNIPAYVGEVFMDLNIDNNSRGLTFTGRLNDESFRVEGSVESSRGRVEYLDAKFRVERFGAEFNRFEIFPEVYGTAFTTVRTDEPVGVFGDTTNTSTEYPQNFPQDIYLKLYVIDPVTKKEVSKGRWEDFRFKLVSKDQVTGETQEQLLSYLGYSVRNLQHKAGEVGLTMTENFLIRPLYRPLERRLERGLKLDYVRLRSSFTSNLFYLSFQDRAKEFGLPTFLNAENNSFNPALLLLRSSELTLGKYLMRQIYMTYTGQLVSGYNDTKLGLNHTVGMEYRLLYNLLLEVEYNKFRQIPLYNDNITDDFRIRLRHSFNF